MKTTVLGFEESCSRCEALFNPANIASDAAQASFVDEWMAVRRQIVQIIEDYCSKEGLSEGLEYVVQDWPGLHPAKKIGYRSIDLTFMETGFLSSKLFNQFRSRLQELPHPYRVFGHMDVPGDDLRAHIIFYPDSVEVWSSSEELAKQIVGFFRECPGD